MKYALILLMCLSWNVFSIPIQRPQAVKNPHGDLDMDCGVCHTTAKWGVDEKNIAFDHSDTGFPLLGAHGAESCTDCHESMIFSNIGSACADCHTDIHRGELGKDCEQCHNPTTWENRQTVFHQHQQTRFPLLGAHALTDCEACHVNEQRNSYKNTPIDCNSCHADDYMATEDPNHREAGFPMECETCHPAHAFSWDQSTFDHSIFPLRGAHARTVCESCHAERFSGTPRECYSCHQTDYETSSNPDHQAFSFSTDCASCHNEDQWSSSSFDHLAASGFELVGAHRTTFCNECHTNNQVTGLPRDCFGCHETDYRAVDDPDHVAGNYPHDCTTCHTQTAWEPSTFDHNQTAFPLTGAHQTVQCTDCHTNNVYAGTPLDCYSCHAADFGSTDDPDHVANNFDHDCAICHSTSAWEPAAFDHNQTEFPLTGAHQTAACVDCHANGYAGTPKDCYFCHQTEYEETTDPNHQAAGFPQDCRGCHNTSNWDDASFNHDSQYFPIYSGEHRGEWSSCADCHVNTSNYAVFECINCHEHSKSRMDNEHDEVGSYQYNSQACYSCHPRGRGDD